MTDKSKTREGTEITEGRQESPRSRQPQFTSSSGFEHTGQPPAVQALSNMARRGFTEGWNTIENASFSQNRDIPASQLPIESPSKKHRTQQRFPGEATFSMSDMSEVDVSNYATKKRGETMVSERLSEASSIETVTMQKELQHQWKLQELPIKEEQSMSSHNKSDYPLTQHLLKASDKSEESYMEAWKSLSPEQQQEFHREQEDIKRRQYQG